MYSLKQKVVSISLYILIGTILLLSFKFQSVQTVKQGEVEKKFFHPYMQSFTVFLGETLYLFLYLMQRKDWKKGLTDGKKQYRSFIFIVPAIADSFTSILQMIGLNFISGSTFLMFKGSAIVTTMIFSKLLIRKKLQKRHYVGCSLSILGMVLVALSSLFQPENSQAQSGNEFTGYMLMLISIIFNGFFYAYEEYLLKKYHINFYEMIAYEGIYGGIIVLSLTIMLSFIPCSLGERVCIYDMNNKGYFENPIVYLNEITSNPVLGLLTLSGTFLIGLFILNGIKITKMFDALTKSIINITKTTVVWAIGIVVTFIVGSDSQIQLQSLNLNVNLAKAVGFSIIICGNLIYNKIIFKKYFASNEQQSTIKQSLMAKQQKIIGTSTFQQTRIENDQEQAFQNLTMVKEDQIQ